jgi:hypothetical protein
MADKPRADQLIGVYRTIRAAIDEKEDAHKKEIEALKKDLEAVSNGLLQICNEQNVDSIKTAHGTAIRTVKSQYWTTDWQAMYRFIKEHDAFHLLQQRISNSNMKTFIEENPDAYPVGLQCDRSYALSVRKPTNK